MAKFVIGISGGGKDTAAAIDSAVRAERLGLSAVWMTSGAGLDPIGLCDVASAKTERVLLGTAIAHMWAMAPVKMAHLGQIAAQLSGGRFRLGIGPTSRPAAEGIYGQTYTAPLGHLREYVQIVKALVETGSVDFSGRYYRASHKMAGSPAPMPVMISALRSPSFELAGEVADGAISWVTPGEYIRDVAVPAVNKGAAKAGRSAPPVIVHVPVCLNSNLDEVREAARKQFGFYVRAPHYQAMFVAAGFPEAAQGVWSDAMLDAVVVSGDEVAIERRLGDLVSWGAAELLVSPVTGSTEQATLGLLAKLAS